MADNNKTLLITGGVSTTVQADYTPSDLAPNNYLTIIWKDKQGKQYNSLDINDKEALQFTNDLNNAIEQGITSGNVSYIGSTRYVNVESIAKYLAQNMIESSPKRTIVNGFIGLLTGSRKELNDSTKNLIVSIFGEVAEKTARAFGFSDPHEIFASFASENTIKLFSELGKQASDYIQDCVAKFKNRGKNGTSIKSKTSESGDKNTGKEYIGLILGLTTSDTESYDITIPRKKVEDGSDYTTHLLPQAFKKDFNVILTNKVLSTDYNRTLEIENIEKVKDKLIEIAQSRILFDIYIRLSADKCYKRSNVYFSSISFTKDEGSGNNYTCSFSVEPITAFKAKTFVSNRKYFPTASKPQNYGYGGYSGGGKINEESGYGGTPSGTYNDFSSNGAPIKTGWVSESSKLQNQTFKNEKEMFQTARKENCEVLWYPDTLNGINYRFENKNNIVTAVIVRRTIIKGTQGSKTKTIAVGSIRALRSDCKKGTGKEPFPNPNFYYLKDGVWFNENTMTIQRPGKARYYVTKNVRK